MPIRISNMKDQYFGVQVVGNFTSLKRMVASIYLEDAKQHEQTIKVCVSDDLPHVTKSCDEKLRSGINKNNELIESGMLLSIGYGKSLTIFANIAHTDANICTIEPNEEIIVSPEKVWKSEAAITVDYTVTLKKPNDQASIQVSIYSQDEGGNEIPLCVPPRVRVQWVPKNITGVSTLRRVLEANKSKNEDNTSKRSSWNVSRQPYMQQYFLQARGKSSTLPRHQQTTFSAINSVVEQKAKIIHERKISADRTSTSSSYNSDKATTLSYNSDKVTSVSYNSDKSSNLANSWDQPSAQYDPTSTYKNNYNSLPVNSWNSSNESTHKSELLNRNKPLRLSQQYDSTGEPLPQWARGLGEQFNYDDVVVV